MSISAVESLTHLDLDSAIRSRQLIVGFEPYVSLHELKARGAELNLVWQHPQYGPLLPSLFMPFVFEQGRSREITGFVLREGARAVADWRRAGLEWTVSINVPLEDLIDGTLPSTIGVLLDEFNLPPEAIVIDIGESDILRFSAQALPAITGLRALGCRVALDSAPGEMMIQDLRGLPFSEIKVSGGAIVQFLDRTRRTGTGRVAARVYNARSNGIPITAVGVDSEAMLWSVQRLEFDAAQGPYICQTTDGIGLIRWEKIWRQAADNIRERKAQSRRSVAGKTAVGRREVPASPASASDVQPSPVPPPPEVAVVEPSESVAIPAPEMAPVEAVAQEVIASDFSALAVEATTGDFVVDWDEEALTAATQDEFEIESDAALDSDQAPASLEPEPEPGEDAVPISAAAAPTDPAAASVNALPLIARRLPGIDKPIVMSVQNQGAQRLPFLKRFGRKG